MENVFQHKFPTAKWGLASLGLITRRLGSQRRNCFPAKLHGPRVRALHFSLQLLATPGNIDAQQPWRLIWRCRPGETFHGITLPWYPGTWSHQVSGWFSRPCSFKPRIIGVGSLVHAWCPGQTESWVIVGKQWAMRNLQTYSLFHPPEFFLRKPASADLTCMCGIAVYSLYTTFGAMRKFSWCPPNIRFWKQMKESA